MIQESVLGGSESSWNSSIVTDPILEIWGQLRSTNYSALAPPKIRFLNHVRYELKQRFLHESEQYAEMETGQTCLAFANEEFIKDSHQFQLNRKDKEAAGAEVAFIVEEVSKAYAHAVEKGATPVLKPVQKPWGQTVSYVRDNNGFIVEICDEVKE